MFENAPAQLVLAGSPSYRHPIGENGRKTLTRAFVVAVKLTLKLAIMIL